MIFLYFLPITAIFDKEKIFCYNIYVRNKDLFSLLVYNK